MSLHLYEFPLGKLVDDLAAVPNCVNGVILNVQNK